MSKQVKVEDLIRQYIKTIVGVDCIDVEIVEDTVVLSREGMWHIYVIQDRWTMIGTFIDEDIELSQRLRRVEGNIRHIYESSKSDGQAVQE